MSEVEEAKSTDVVLEKPAKKETIYAKRKAKSEGRRQKTKAEYSSDLPSDLFVVFSHGKWRMYKNEVQAYKRFAALKKGGRAVQLLRYSILEIIKE